MDQEDPKEYDDSEEARLAAVLRGNFIARALPDFWRKQVQRDHYAYKKMEEQLRRQIEEDEEKRRPFE